MPAQKPLIIYPNTVPVRFIRRLNRFTAEVMIDGRIEGDRDWLDTYDVEKAEVVRVKRIITTT